MLKRNDLVKVFQKPITDEEYEGEARLYRSLKEEDNLDCGERWVVMFSDGMLVDRFVHERNLVKT